MANRTPRALIVTAAVAPLFCLIAALAASADTAGIPGTEPHPSDFSFYFGTGSVRAGQVRVPPDTIYSKSRGYGFEEGAKVAVIDRSAGFCTSDSPFYFSVAVPEGNYRVIVTLGDPEGESTTTVKAELRRLMLEQVHTPAGRVVTRSFVVNVRTPEIAGGGRVRLKSPRETTEEARAWDDKLTLEFNGPRPCLVAMRIEKVEVPTVFILGDSTVCDQPSEPYASWGQMLPRFFGPGVAVANHAESGESLASSTSAGRLDKVLGAMKSGDYLLIQYGHNDMKSKDPGAVQSYKSTLKEWVRRVRSKGGIPVVVTPVNRHTFRGETVENSLLEYPEIVRQVAAEDNVALIDLNAMSKTLYETLGPKESIRLFKHNQDLSQFDGTHHSPYGAYELAKCVVAGIRQSRLGLEKYLADDVPPFDPSKPDPAADFSVPTSGNWASHGPSGN
jgi:lysophospholipase L1-like esterase